MKDLKVVNILGEPGSGKSLTSAGLLYQLGIRGHKVELVQEAAKDHVWEAIRVDEKKIPPYILSDQLFLFSEQNRRIERLRGQREIAIVECPLLMSLVYRRDGYYSNFDKLVLEVYNSYNNINIFLERNHTYDQDGRVQNEQETNSLREEIIKVLDKNLITYKIFKTHKLIDLEIADYIENYKA